MDGENAVVGKGERGGMIKELDYFLWNILAKNPVSFPTPAVADTCFLP